MHRGFPPPPNQYQVYREGVGSYQYLMYPLQPQQLQELYPGRLMSNQWHYTGDNIPNEDPEGLEYTKSRMSALARAAAGVDRNGLRPGWRSSVCAGVGGAGSKWAAAVCQRSQNRLPRLEASRLPFRRSDPAGLPGSPQSDPNSHNWTVPSYLADPFAGPEVIFVALAGYNPLLVAARL